MSQPSPGVRSAKGRTVIRHGKLRKAGPWGAIALVVATIFGTAVVSVVSVGAIVAGQIVAQAPPTVTIPEDVNPPDIGALKGGFNILIVGSDTRKGQRGIGGSDAGVLNDVTMLIHVSQDHTNAIGVSFPRDMVVPYPVCPSGGRDIGLPINNALSYGGLTCVVDVVQNFTGVKIQFAGLITFTGVVAMANAIGGVQVCVNQAIHDPDTGLSIKHAGYVTLKGFQALAFLRSRHGVGDGSDLGRINSQQVYLSSLVRKLKSENTLSNFSTLYNLANAAARNMTLSKNFANVPTMIAIAQALKDIPVKNINFVQYPGTTAGTGIFTGKVQPNLTLGNQLFAAIRADKQIKLGTTTSIGSVKGQKPKPSATATPSASPTTSPSPTDAPAPTPTKKGSSVTINGLPGQPASDYTCSKAFGT
jgi:LCP family protein required for cell wall assembly